MGNDKILITGSAGFIGASLSKYLLKKGHKVIGIDNMNSYYDVNLKRDRIKDIEKNKNSEINWNFFNFTIEDKKKLNEIFNYYKPNIVVHLAAQPGVRYSLKNPSQYIKSNIVGFGNILETCKEFNINNLIYASSSSVYGGNQNLPYKENHNVDHPLSLYAATKRSNELMAHTYSYLYKIPCTGLRFFTVYGPWGRPDMAPIIFADSILKNKPIRVFNQGFMIRDFTYIDDIVESIYRCCMKPAQSNINFSPISPIPDSSFAPYKIFNIGNGVPIKLIEFIETLEYVLEKKAIKIFEPMQPGDVKSTAADTTKLFEWINFKPKTNLKKGIKEFISWFKSYY